MQPPRLPLYRALLSLLIAAMVGLVAYYIHAGDAAAQAAAQEGQFIDATSAAGYFLCAAVMLIAGGREYLRHHWQLLAATLLLGFRELDFDKKFSTLGLFKSNTFLSDQVSITEKCITLVIVAFVVWLAISLLKRYTGPLLRKMRNREQTALTTAVALALLFSARLLDGSSRKLHWFNIQLSEHGEVVATIIEEVLELGIPYTLTLAVLTFTHKAFRAPHEKR